MHLVIGLTFPNDNQNTWKEWFCWSRDNSTQFDGFDFCLFVNKLKLNVQLNHFLYVF